MPVGTSVLSPSASPLWRTMLGRDRLRGVAVDVGGHHLGAGARELLRIDLADALAAAGDDGDAAFQVEAWIGSHGRSV